MIQVKKRAPQGAFFLKSAPRGGAVAAALRLGAKIAHILPNAGQSVTDTQRPSYTAAWRENRPYLTKRRTKGAQGADKCHDFMRLIKAL
jgi:hypothetical protein